MRVRNAMLPSDAVQGPDCTNGGDPSLLAARRALRASTSTSADGKLLIMFVAERVGLCDR